MRIKVVIQNTPKAKCKYCKHKCKWYFLQDKLDGIKRFRKYIQGGEIKYSFAENIL